MNNQKKLKFSEFSAQKLLETILENLLGSTARRCFPIR